MAGKVIALMCERSCDMTTHCKSSGEIEDLPGVYVVKLPCSGMVQPAMIEAALKAGAEGVVVTGCQIGDCYYREGNKMIKERLLGERPPGLKKAVDRRRVLGLWLSRLQPDRFIAEVKEFKATLKSMAAADSAQTR